VDAVRDQLRKEDREHPPAVEAYASGGFEAAALAGSVAASDTEAVIFLGAQAEFDALVRELANRSPVPRIYLLSSLILRPMAGLPAVFDQRVFLAYPTLSSDITPRGRQEYQELAKFYSWPSEHIQAQLAALAAAKLFVEGLRKAGRDLSRVRLVGSGPRQQDLQTGGQGLVRRAMTRFAVRVCLAGRLL
jgi:ABC-type branched-subunit amino acid transport system substrate-binding protein